MSHFINWVLGIHFFWGYARLTYLSWSVVIPSWGCVSLFLLAHRRWCHQLSCDVASVCRLWLPQHHRLRGRELASCARWWRSRLKLQMSVTIFYVLINSLNFEYSDRIRQASSHPCKKVWPMIGPSVLLFEWIRSLPTNSTQTHTCIRKCFTELICNLTSQWQRPERAGT